MLGDYLDGLRKRGSSIGAVIEVVADGVPAGLGAPIYGKLDGDLAAALMSINAVKGVEIGAGFAAAELTGEQNGDEMRMGNDGKPLFLSNNAGGILGGISTGQPVVARFAVKPTSSILIPRRTVDRYGRETEISTTGRHDPCVGIRAVPIGEAMVACVIADHYLRQRGQVGETPAWPFAPTRLNKMNDTHQRIQSVVAAFARGEIVIVADDDDRENEGDLFVAASLCTPEKMAFIIRNTSGHRLRAAGSGGGAAAASRSDGGAQRCAARHRVHRLGRRPPRPHHRDFRGRTQQYRARARQRQ